MLSAVDMRFLHTHVTRFLDAHMLLHTNSLNIYSIRSLRSSLRSSWPHVPVSLRIRGAHVHFCLITEFFNRFRLLQASLALMVFVIITFEHS